MKVKDSYIQPCKYKKYRHPFKYLTAMVFIFLLLCIINYTSIVLAFNYDEYDFVTGYAEEVGEDALFGVLPRIKWKYTYNNETYFMNSLMVRKWLFWDNYDSIIGVYVNKKVPDDALLYFDIKHSIVNYLLFGLMIFCLWQIILGKIINHRIRVFRKYERRRRHGEQEREQVILEEKLSSKQTKRIASKSLALEQKD